MKRGACQHAKRAAPFWGTALRLDLGCTRSGGLFHALSGGTACFQLLLETAAGLEAGDGGGLQTAGDLGLGVGVSLGLAGTHLKRPKPAMVTFSSARRQSAIWSNIASIVVSTCASVKPVLRATVSIIWERVMYLYPPGVSKSNVFWQFCVVEYNIIHTLFATDCAQNVIYCARTYVISLRPSQIQRPLFWRALQKAFYG